MEYTHVMSMQVRDYECDVQGLVNNSVYQNYLEHARHTFLHTQGVDFAELARNQVNLVVIKVELEYKRSLRPGDEFWIGTRLERVSRLKFQFMQDIFLKPDDTLVLKGIVTGTSVSGNGRPMVPQQLAHLFDKT